MNWDENNLEIETLQVDKTIQIKQNLKLIFDYLVPRLLQVP
jgi:flagellin-specific chaperone FliS